MGEFWWGFFRPRFDRVGERFAWAIGLLGEKSCARGKRRQGRRKRGWIRGPILRLLGLRIIGLDGPGLENFLGWTWLLVT